MSFSLQRFAPRVLRLEGVGPFQDHPFTLEFTTHDGETANLFLIVGVNGLGKTTLLESIAWLVSLLQVEHLERAGRPDWLEDHDEAHMQLDLELEVVLGGMRQRGILSLVAAWAPPHGTVTDPLLHRWTPDELGAAGYAFWVTRGFERAPSGTQTPVEVALGVEPMTSDTTVLLLQNLLSALSIARDNEPLNIRRRPDPADGVGPTRFAPLHARLEQEPTVLLFTAARDLMPRVPDEARALRRVAGWGWRLVRRFDGETGDWQDSLDHLLVQLDYADEGTGRFALAREIINRHVFFDAGKMLEGVDRDQMAAVIRPKPGQSHRVDRLSSGERSLAQLFVRIAAHMTQNTIVLIDEADLHLHPRWERELTYALKDLVRDRPDQICIVATSHSKDMVSVFAVHRAEPPIRKEGLILDKDDFLGAEEEGR